MKYIIGGVGYKSLNPNLEIEKINIFKHKDIKINIGLACAKILVQNGIDVILISRTLSKLEKIKEDLEKFEYKGKISVKNVNLLNVEEVNNFISSISMDMDYSYIHSAGLSAGNYNVSNPYLEIEHLPVELPTKEFEAVTQSLLIVTQSLLKKMKSQKKARIIVINSMSGIRPYPLGFSHSSAKAGLHNATRSLALELTKHNIFVSEINPGMVDTGHYNTPKVISSIKKICYSFGYEHNELPLMPAESVAEAVLLVIQSKAHMLSINLVAEGQIPHLGA